jgi:membrane carboxypeptidase/penicillin-binding protein
MLKYLHSLINQNIVLHSAKILHKELDVPEYFLKYLFLIEDKRFIFHIGIDPIAITRAAVNNLMYGCVYEGASTITQQLFRTNLEIQEKIYNGKFGDKFNQIIWAIQKELCFSKSEILSEYLRTIYWGRNYYGLHQAASGYFGKGISQLGYEQCFFLAERIAWPNIVNVYRINQLVSIPQIAFDFKGHKCLDRLAEIYDQMFQSKENLCLTLERRTKLLDKRMSKSLQDV